MTEKPKEYRKCVSNDIEYKYTTEKIKCQRVVLWKQLTNHWQELSG